MTSDLFPRIRMALILNSDQSIIIDVSEHLPFGWRRRNTSLSSLPGQKLNGVNLDGIPLAKLDGTPTSAKNRFISCANIKRFLDQNPNFADEHPAMGALLLGIKTKEGEYCHTSWGLGGDRLSAMLLYTSVILLTVITCTTISHFSDKFKANHELKLEAAASIIRTANPGNKTEALIALRKELGEKAVIELPEFELIPAANSQPATLLFRR